MKKPILAISVLIVSGCSALAPQKTSHIKSKAIGDGGDLYSIPANLRTIDVRKKTSDYIICSEPVPDIAMSNVLKLALEASKNQSENASTASGTDSTSRSVSNALGLKGNLDASTTALELAGRTQIVLIAREFLSSNCKARANGWISNADFKESQDKIVDQITAMIDTDKKKAEADKAKAVAVSAAVKAKLNKKALANVGAAFAQAKAEICLSAYDSCISNAAGDATKIKVCRTNLGKCNN